MTGNSRGHCLNIPLAFKNKSLMRSYHVMHMTGNSQGHCLNNPFAFKNNMLEQNIGSSGFPGLKHHPNTSISGGLQYS